MTFSRLFERMVRCVEVTTMAIEKWAQWLGLELWSLKIFTEGCSDVTCCTSLLHQCFWWKVYIVVSYRCCIHWNKNLMKAQPRCCDGYIFLKSFKKRRIGKHLTHPSLTYFSLFSLSPPLVRKERDENFNGRFGCCRVSVFSRNNVWNFCWTAWIVLHLIMFSPNDSTVSYQCLSSSYFQSKTTILYKLKLGEGKLYLTTNGMNLFKVSINDVLMTTISVAIAKPFQISCYNNPNHWVQRWNCRIQEHFIHCMGCRWTR